MKSSKVLVTCPQCGHSQQEPSAAYSSVCKKCGQYFRLENVKGGRASARSTPTPAPAAPAEPARETRHISCFQCGTDLDVPLSAQTTMCKRCSAHVDLMDHQISGAVSKNFRTKGRIVIEESGFLFNTETIASQMILKGRFLGKLVVEQTLEIHRTAEFKGTFTAGRVLIPAGHVLRWPDTLALTDAEIVGELVGRVQATGTMFIRSSARVFGNIAAKNLVVEIGAVVVGQMEINANVRTLNVEDC